ncbi:response regulator [Fibrella aquatica]|jgi:CheY-like chemotaxis protein|uniref:response regulator n=1 Tax=Fibrella aquatica TaxID=3242487 RepID=UPI0035211213
MMKEPAIFLVDDDDDDVYLARLTFATHFPKWKLTSFDDGQALIDHFVSHPESPLPDMIILDLNMPRLTGYETLTILKRHNQWKKVPVAILSTSSNVDDQTRSEAMGACAFMVKPPSIDELASLILEGKSACESSE